MSAYTEEPKTFSLDDRDLIFVRSYRLRKDINSKFSTGACPEVPCATVVFAGLNYSKDPPHAYFQVELDNGERGGLYGPEKGKQGASVRVRLKRGCYSRIRSVSYDVMIEVRDDRLDTLRIWVALLNGTVEKGVSIDYDFC